MYLLKLTNLSQNKNKYHLILKKKHKIIDFLGFFEINLSQKLTYFKINFHKFKFYLKFIKLDSKSLVLINSIIKI